MMSLSEILSLAFRHRRKVIAALIIPPAIAIVLLLVLPKVYRAQSDIMVKTGREYLSASDGDNNNAGGPTSTKQEDINSEISLLTSRAVIQSTIKAIGVRNIFPDLADNPPTNMTLDDAAVELFMAALSVEPVKMSNVISTTFDAPSPAQAQEVLDRLIQVYIAKHTQVFAGQRTEGYEDAIKTTLRDIDRLEALRTKIKLDSGIYDITAQRGALITQRVNAEGHLQDVIDNESTLTKRLAYLTSVRSHIPTTMQSTNTDKSDEAVHAREALIDLQQTESALSARYGTGNPDLQRVRGQIATLQHTLASTSNSRTSTASAPSPLRQQVEQEVIMDDAQLAPLDAERIRYQALLTTLSNELQRLETADLALRTTTSRLDALTDNLKAMQARFQQARTQEQTELAKQVSVVQVSPAIAPSKPVKPKKVIYLGASLLLGLLSAGGVVVISVLLNKTVVTEDAAERLLGMPVLVSMPLRSRRAGPMTLEME
jgi:uncharacterized protein involved in exopolysaccharide biosynthesis